MYSRPPCCISGKPTSTGKSFCTELFTCGNNVVGSVQIEEHEKKCSDTSNSQCKRNDTFFAVFSFTNLLVR